MTDALAPMIPETPEQADLPDEKNKPSDKNMPVNWAAEDGRKIKTTIEEVQKMAARNFLVFDGQSARANMMDRMKDADRLWRCSETRDEDDDQYQSTKSNMATDMYNRTIRSIVSSLTFIMFPNDHDLPVEFVVDPRYAKATNDAVGEEQANWQNALESYYFTADDRRRKLEESLNFLEKYGMQVYAMEYDFLQQERKVRVVNEDTGKVVVRKKKVTVADHPTLRAIDLGNIWFDANISDGGSSDIMQQQQCIIVKSLVTYSDLVAEQASGNIVNVDEITTKQQYGGDQSTNAVQADRQTNAGETNSALEPTTQFPRYDVWTYAPINEDTGKWDTKKTVAKKYWATFIGEWNNAPVCVRLCRNPYWHDKFPFKLVHSDVDDKGAFNMGLLERVSGLHEELNTSYNQWTDNKNLILRAPWLMEMGAVLTKNLTFDPNKLFITAIGQFDKFKRLEVPSVTNDMLPFIQDVRSEYKSAAGTEKTLLGEALGGRTSASEASNIYQQAMKPILAHARYLQRQLLPWMAEMDMELGRQFADPDVILILTGTNNDPIEVMPSQLHLPLFVKAIAVERFEKTALMRLEEDKLLQLVIPVMASGRDIPEGLSEMLKDVYRARGFSNVEKYFPAPGDYDAANMARMENYVMVYEGQPDEPEQKENHRVHVSEHKPYLAYADTNNDGTEEGRQLLRSHIAAHEVFMGQAVAGPSSMPQGMAQGMSQGAPEMEEAPGMGGMPGMEAEGGPRVEGEAGGDMLGAALGG